MNLSHILITGTYDNHFNTSEEGTDFQFCQRSDATHISVYLVDVEGNAEPVKDFPLGDDPARAYVDAFMRASKLSVEREKLRILDTYQKRAGQLKDLGALAYPRVEMVRGHKHTCANVQPGSTAANVCDCGAVVDGKPVPVSAPPKLTVWCGPMPESNGKQNYTAILRREGLDEDLFNSLTQGITIARSEYPGRVMYEADRMRYLIGELAVEPFILDYDTDKHSGYVHPDRFEQMAESKGYDVTKTECGHYLDEKTQHLRAGWDAARTTW